MNWFRIETRFFGTKLDLIPNTFKNMAETERHKCFISFKKENEAYKKTIKDAFGDNSLIKVSINQ